MYEIDLRGGSVPQIQEEVVITPSTEVQYAVPQMPYNTFAKVTVNAVDPSACINNQSKTVDSSTVSQTVEPDSGYTGLDSVTVNPYRLSTLQFTRPSTSTQWVETESGYDGMKRLKIFGVDSTIDSNIQPENIKKDVTILGVTGTLESGSSAVEEKDVNFIDSSGDLLYSYTSDEFLELTELPANISEFTDLTATGWNWTLSGAKSFVQKYGKLTIGQFYTASDNKARIVIEITKPNTTFWIYWSNVSGGIKSISWGDGNTSMEYATTGTKHETHTYTTTGKFTIKFSFNSTSASVELPVYYNSSDTLSNNIVIREFHAGTNSVIIGFNGLSDCPNLMSITTTGSSLSGVVGLHGCTSLKSLTTEAGGLFTNLSYQDFYGLRYVSFAESSQNIMNYGFNSTSAEVICIPNVKTSQFDKLNLTGNNNLRYLVIDGDVVCYPNINDCVNLEIMYVPESVTKFYSAPFDNKPLLKEIYMYPVTPPAFPSSSFKTNLFTIYVPSESIESYKTVSGWTDVSTNIQAIPS